MTTTNNASQVEATTSSLTLFVNIFAQIKNDINSRASELINQINEATDLNKWVFTDLLPKSKTLNSFASIEEAKQYLCKRVEKDTVKKIAKELAHLQDIEAAPDFKYFNITVEWKRSQMWGANPRANGYDYNGSYDSGSVGCCGYDKPSTAVANVLNQSLALKKALYLYRENNMDKPLMEVFGYGSGYKVLPYFDGGVGVSCYPDIFEKIGFTFRQIANGKTFDAFEVTKKA